LWGGYLTLLIVLILYVLFRFPLDEILQETKGLAFILGVIPASAYLLYMFLRPPKLYFCKDGFEIKSPFLNLKQKWSEASSFEVVENGVFKAEEIAYQSVSSEGFEEKNTHNMIPFSFSHSNEDLANLLNEYRHQALKRNLNDQS